MYETAFNFGIVPRRYADVVQRIAVLHNIFRSRSMSSDDAVRDAVESLLGMWRARVACLGDHGWLSDDGYSPQHSLSYAKNCLPNFAISSPKTRLCCRRTICPFCYGRWVLSQWQAIDDSFKLVRPEEPVIAGDAGTAYLTAIESDTNVAGEIPNGDSSEEFVFPFHLVYREHTFYRNIVPNDRHDADAYNELLSLTRSVAASRSQVVRMVDPQGAFLFTTVEPYEDDTWRFRHRQIFKLSASQELPQTLVERTSATDGRLIRYTRPTRRVIMRVTAQACRYPTRLLTGDPARTVLLLTARSRDKFRASANYRSFRRKRS